MSKTTTPPTKSTFKEVLRAGWKTFSWGYSSNRRSFILMFFLIIGVSVLPFVNTYINSLVIDEVIALVGLDQPQRNYDLLIKFIVVDLVITLLVSTFWILVSYLEKQQFFKLAKFFTLKFIEKSSTLDMYHYENPESNNVIQKAKDIYEWRPRQFLNRLIWMVSDFIRIVTSIGIILSFSFPAFLLVLFTTVPSLLANLKFGSDSWGIWDANANTRRRYWWSKDLLAKEESLMEIRIFRTRNYLLNVVNGIYDSFMEEERKDQVKRTVFESLFGNISVVGTVIFWVIAIYATLQGNITVGLLSFYAGATNRFSDALNNFFRNLSKQYEEALYLVDYYKFMDLKNRIVDGVENLPASTTPPFIEFRNVWFKYPGTDKYILQDFNLKLAPGERIALVGVNGAGKTTIIKLLCRFYDPDKGAILVNGIDLKDLSLDSWYRCVGVLFQNFVQYKQFTVRQNVELGDVDHIGDEEQVLEAIHKADAKSFIDEYKLKLEQILDKSFEEGVSPSGGQWQKIALARAFFRDAPILILDEPTSAIDAKAEYEIFQRLYKFSENKTVIIISHRFSTVRQADKIYVIDKGSIVEQGTHQELIDLSGPYAKAFEVQAQGYK